MRMRMCIIAGLLLMAAFLLGSSVAFADATTTRTLPDTVNTGEQFTVSIYTELVNGGIAETIPTGFTYVPPVSHDCGGFQVIYNSAQNKLEITYMTVMGWGCPGTFTYDVIAPGGDGIYDFVGQVKDFDGDGTWHPMGGDTQVEVLGVIVEDVVINEIIANPDGGSECIELYNNEPSAVDLTGWSIQDGTGQPDPLDGKVIPAGGYLSLMQGTDFDFQLNNTGGDLVDLIKGATFVDTVAYGNWDDGNVADNAPIPGSGESIGRWPNGADTDVDLDDFMLFNNPPDCGPTCGAANICMPPGVEVIRTLPNGCVAPGAVFEVSVYVEGISSGGIEETLPNGVTFSNVHPGPGTPTAELNGQVLDIGIVMCAVGTNPYVCFPGTITYECTAPAVEGQYTFNGILDGATLPPLFEPSNVSIMGDQVLNVCTSQNPQVMFAAGGYNVNEGDTVTVNVTVNPPVAVGSPSLTVHYETYDNTATAPGDYTSVTGMLTFAPGVTTQSFDVTAKGDTVTPENENLGVRLFNVQNGEMGAPNDINITINDVAPGQVWECPAGDVNLTAPYPSRNRPELLGPVDCSTIMKDVDWFIIAWLVDEVTGQYIYYNSQLADLGIPQVLDQLLPGEYYVVITSGAGSIWW